METDRRTGHGWGRRARFVTVLCVLALGWPLLVPTSDDGGQFTVSRDRLPLAFGREGGDWVSDVIDDPGTVVGLSWEDEAPEGAWLRAKGPEGWSPWMEVEVEDEHVPDPGTPEAADHRAASAPIVIGDVTEAIQFRVTAPSIPDGLNAELIEVEDERPAKARRTGILRGSSAEGVPSKPTIVPRSSWGGDECLAKKGASAPDYVRRVYVMFIHHTATTNDYSEAKAPAIVRSICEYHVYSNGWSDIGYNFLVDKYGNIYEGRAGGVEAGVQGAHTGGFNSYSTGTAFIGTHGTLEPTSKSQSALVRLASWKLDLHHVEPTKTTWLKSLGSSKYSSGTWVEMANVSGHRDASSTSCPGWACYVLLDSLKTEIKQHQNPKIFGGWPTPDPMVGNARDGYKTAKFSASFSESATWTFQIRHGSTLILKKTGTGTSVSFDWNGTKNGSNLPAGTYEVWVDATTANGTPRPVRDTFQLGSFLPPFVDDDGSVHEVDISYIAGEGVAKGCNPPANDRYCPGDNVTRAQMAAFLVRALGLKETSSISFKDVKAGSTFEADINKLATAGITKGCNPPANDRYCPYDPVSRAQMASFLARAMKDHLR